MTAFVLSANTNIDALASKAGGDTYDTNGWELTIDQDSRVGLNQTTSTSLGSMTINSTKGGQIHVDGTGVWIIPYTGGSGNVPAWNTVITNNTGSGKLIGVHSALTAASTATGAAMPASGYIRVKQKTGTYSAAALSGITATASDAGRIGWLEIVGDESAGVVANRLGIFRTTGAWFALGTTSGTSNQTLQIPNNGLQRYVAGVFIEKTAGEEDYEFYPNAGTVTTVGTEAARGKVVWIDNTGLVRIGNSGAATNGYTPASGLAVVVPNIFFEICTTAARTANVIPNATIATRYDFTTTGGGVLEIDKGNFAWYLSASQAYSVNVSNSGFVDGILLAETASAMTFTRVGVGNKPTTALAVSALNMTYCYAGGTFTDCVWGRVTHTVNAYTVTISDCSGFNFVDNTFRANTIRNDSSVSSVFGTRLKNCTWTRPVIIQGAMSFSTCSGITVTDIAYCGAVSGTTVSTYAEYIFNLNAASDGLTFSGLTLPVTNTHPYTAIMIGANGVNDARLRNIATYESPLDLGSANACGLIYSIGTGCSNFKLQRIYTINSRTGIGGGDNSCKDVTEENVHVDYADAADVMACLNMKRKGMAGTGALTAQASVYGTHWRDSFTSTTAGRISILMNEPTTDTAAQVTLANGSAFTSNGGLYMPVIGHSATFEMPEYIIGHTGFQNSALVMAGGTVGNYSFEYSIDKNDGAGWSALTSADYTAAALGTALNGLTGIDASLGFKLRLEITTTTTNTTAITSVYVLTGSSTTAQGYQYPLDVSTFTINGVPVGSEVRCYTGSKGASAVEIGGTESTASSTFSFTHVAGGTSGFIHIVHPDYEIKEIDLVYPASDYELLIQMADDKWYSNPA